MGGFIYLKRTYPTSQFERECDAYKFLMENSTPEQRVLWGINDQDLKKTIKQEEKYIYQVGKDGDQLKTMCSSFENFALVREHIFGIKDE